jgi:molybdopterin/thiamine biosynthesis adenylyltransferase/rhodanese-related sulfurtransferase
LSIVGAVTGLSDGERRRYARHLALPEVGEAGQERLRGARVLCVGAGGLGSPFLLYLAAAGVGTLGVVDFDAVEESNLQRQVLFGASDVGRAKGWAAAAHLSELNPYVTVVRHGERLAAANAREILAGYDVIADGTDNFAARYLVNDACVLLGKPNAYASVYRFEGQASVFGAANGPCYRCLFPEPPPAGLVPSCAEGGVLGVLPGLLGLIQATEVLKLLLGAGEPLVGRLLVVDALAMSFCTVRLRKNPACPVCGERPTITGLSDVEEACGLSEIAPAALRDRLSRGEEILLLDVREPWEMRLAVLPGSRAVPLGELPGGLHTLPRDARIVVLCRSGARSAVAVGLLRTAGFPDVSKLAGGLERWRRDVDPAFRLV